MSTAKQEPAELEAQAQAQAHDQAQAKAQAQARAEAEVLRIVDELRPLVEQLRELNDQARALGLFAEDRPLLRCETCGLTEDELANGRHVTYFAADITDFEPDGSDTGLRFIADETDEERFTCPACSAEVRLEPDELDEPDEFAPL